jgi:hypothetical protein
VSWTKGNLVVDQRVRFDQLLDDWFLTHIARKFVATGSPSVDHKARERLLADHLKCGAAEQVWRRG